MTRKHVSHILLIILILIAVLPFQASAQILQRLNGLALNINPNEYKFTVLFEHPVTGEEIVKIFHVSDETGFKGVKKLQDIKKNDPVTVDYQEVGETLKAVYIEVVPMQGVPFTKEQVKKRFGFFF